MAKDDKKPATSEDMTPEQRAAKAVEAAAAKEAQEMTDRLARNVGGAVVPPLTAREVIKEGDETVKMNFPRKVRLTLDDHRVIVFEAGVNEVPVSLQDHFYLKAHKVKAV